MKYSKITIETDGTSANTKLFIDGKQISLIQRLDFSADVKETFVHLGIQMCRMVNGHIKTKKVKVRDQKSEKFIEQDEAETQPLQLERQ